MRFRENLRILYWGKRGAVRDEEEEIEKEW